MDVISAIADAAVVVVVALGVVAWRSFGSAAEHAAKEQAAEILRELNWPGALARELEQVRGTERQELRFVSYGKLWSTMRPFAIYDDAKIDREAMQGISKKLSDWYFSADGGLMLTGHCRDLYFALQDLVFSAAGAEQPWDAERGPEPRAAFKAMLERRRLTGAQRLIDYLDDDARRAWPNDELRPLTLAWHTEVVDLAGDWADLDRGERYAALQQVSSVLRTGLAWDVESRLR